MPKKASELTMPRAATMMIYGDNTAGKSTSVVKTAPKPLLILDVDNRPQTYAGMKGVEYEIYKNSGRTATAYRELSKDLRTLSREKDLKYNTIALDSTTSLLDIITDDILGLGGKGSGAHEGLDLKHWGSVDERFRKLFGYLKGFDCLGIAISHEQIFKDDTTGAITYATMRVGKKISTKAPGYFDEIYRAFVEKDRRTDERRYLFQTQRDGRYPARTSYNLHDEEGETYPILDVEEPQDISAILNKIERGLEKPEETLKRLKKEREQS